MRRDTTDPDETLSDADDDPLCPRGAHSELVHDRQEALEQLKIRLSRDRPSDDQVGKQVDLDEDERGHNGQSSAQAQHSSVHPSQAVRLTVSLISLHFRSSTLTLNPLTRSSMMVLPTVSLPCWVAGSTGGSPSAGSGTVGGLVSSEIRAA